MMSRNIILEARGNGYRSRCAYGSRNQLVDCRRSNQGRRSSSTLAILAFFFITCASSSFACGLDWGAPENHFDGVNEHGDLSYWKQIGSLDIGEAQKIPLVVGFSSARTSDSPYLGKGWILPLLESNVVQFDSKRFLMLLPDGLTVRLKRKTETDTSLTGQGGAWMAQITDNTITAWASCGWKIVFVNGKISSITTPQNKQLSFNYTNGSVKEIDDGPSPLLNVIADSVSNTVSGLSFNGSQISFEQGRMPNVETINGQNVIGEVQSSLSKLTLVDGSSENFKYSVAAGITPTLDITGIDSRSFSWNATTKLILKDGDWSYNITPGATFLDNAQIQRSNNSGQTESWFNDRKSGMETLQDINGNKTIIKRFTNAGPLNNKIRSLQTFAPDGTLAQNETFSYDENSKLIRKMIQVVVVDDDGKRETINKLMNF